MKQVTITFQFMVDFFSFIYPFMGGYGLVFSYHDVVRSGNWCFREADILAFPHFYEEEGFVVVEAPLVEILIGLTDIGNHPEIAGFANRDNTIRRRLIARPFLATVVEGWIWRTLHITINANAPKRYKIQSDCIAPTLYFHDGALWTQSS